MTSVFLAVYVAFERMNVADVDVVVVGDVLVTLVLLELEKIVKIVQFRIPVVTPLTIQ